MVQTTSVGEHSEHVAYSRERARALVEASYPEHAAVAKECDLVMKGGITSGVVYPLAICELAKTYRFRNVGGSSAGAIAAVMAAAAEHGRDSGGFQRLAALPDQIGPTLPLLFTSGPHTRTAHAALMTFLDPKAGIVTKIRRAVVGLVKARVGVFALAAAFVVVLGISGVLLASGLPGSGGDLIRLLVVAPIWQLPLALLVGVIIALWFEARSTWGGLSRQGFGLCVGSAGSSPQTTASSGPGSLTDWLATKIDEVAGVPGPLTFGQLWGDGQEREVDLRVMTTNLTLGRPMSFPFGGDTFLFDPVELGQYFPAAVIDCLTRNQEPAVDETTGAPLMTADARPLFRFPEPSGIPVVLAARVSLSFPGLISAVPLYTVDRSRRRPEDQKPVRCWLSDGGMTANFPIHFFDALWPKRPTFGLDLQSYHPDYQDSDVYYPGHAEHGRQSRVTEINSVGGFFAAILTTMQYWADDAQSTLPGFRDRVVEVHLRDYEGGMNLQMPPDVVSVVAEKGRHAAEELSSFDFEQHRWTRYLTAMSELQDVISWMRDRYESDLPGGEIGYRKLLLTRAAEVPHYKREGAWPKEAEARTSTLLTFGAATVPDFSKEAPHPDPVLRITPRF
jgi:predicted acylesterase/phospholipase RssA